MRAPSTDTPVRPTAACWLCGQRELSLLRPSTLREELRPESFRITDDHYGAVGAIYRCEACGFLQCPEVGDVLGMYAQMDDPAYVASEDERRLQARRLLASIAKRKSRGRLLDVGAGSGLLVDEASRLGFDASGVEPSSWLQAQARRRGCRVELGTLPHPNLQGPHDIVTAIDVIEHVDDPVGLLRQMRAAMADDGLGVVVTPDVGSVAARLTGARWWHFRAAHIGYFSRETLLRALDTAGLELVSLTRPWWYFSGDYLWNRLMVYAPERLKMRPPRLAARVTVPLNLFDSYMATFRKR